MSAIGLSFLLVVVTLAATEPAGTSAAASQPTPVETSMGLKQTKPTRVVFLEHIGPYWTVGVPFSRARERMLANGETGPAFVRCLDDPATTPPDSLRTQIGYMASKSDHVEAPFLAGQLNGEWVAWMAVDGPSRTTTHIHARLRAWLKDRGYEPVGPLVELFPTNAWNARADESRTEIQIAVRHVGGTNDGRVSPEVASDGRSVDTSEPLPADPAPVVVSGWDAIVERLIPMSPPLPALKRAWVGQVVVRVGAVAKGVQQVYPGQARETTVLAERLAERYRHIASPSELHPVTKSIHRIDPRANPIVQEQQAIIRDLDLLLGRLGQRTVSPEESLTHLNDILTHAAELISENWK